MKSIFDREPRVEIINRINTLNATSQPKWGKMTVAQMLRHCSLCEEYYFGNIKVKRSLIGRIFGKTAIKEILKDENSTLKKNAYTSPTFKVSNGITSFSEEKQKWEKLIERYSIFNNEETVHWFFGRMTKNQLGQLVHKHCDHHLRQFGV